MSRIRDVGVAAASLPRIEWCYRRPADDRRPPLRIGPSDLTIQTAVNLTPEKLASVRELHGYQGMRNRPGLAWSESTRQLLQCESGLEMFAVRLLDFEGQLEAVIAQPFLLHLQTRRPDGEVVRRRHVPDFFARVSDGTLVVIDVHRVLRDRGVKSRDVLDATAMACRGVGWAYRIITEPPPMLRRNMELILGYRAVPLYADEVLGAVKAELSARPLPWGRLVAAVAAVTGLPGALVMPGLLHGLWQQAWSVDLTKQLSNDTLVSIKGQL